MEAKKSHVLQESAILAAYAGIMAGALFLPEIHNQLPPEIHSDQIQQFLVNNRMFAWIAITAADTVGYALARKGMILNDLKPLNPAQSK